MDLKPSRREWPRRRGVSAKVSAAVAAGCRGKSDLEKRPARKTHRHVYTCTGLTDERGAEEEGAEFADTPPLRGEQEPEIASPGLKTLFRVRLPVCQLSQMPSAAVVGGISSSPGKKVAGDN